MSTKSSLRFFQSAFWIFFLAAVNVAMADENLVTTHCRQCHNEQTKEGDFSLVGLGPAPEETNLNDWLEALDRVNANEMPPPDADPLSDADRAKLVAFFKTKLERFHRQRRGSRPHVRPRRLNNREFARSVADALMIEDVGTHFPTDNLIGDSRYHGFDTHGETLGFSKFHLEQSINAIRKIVDATILTGKRPKTQRYDIAPEKIFEATTAQNVKRPDRPGEPTGFDFLDPRRVAYFKEFKTTPTTGWYRIRIRCQAMDHGRYDEEDTGIYDADPIQLMVQMGDRQRTYDLPNDQEYEIELVDWMAAGRVYG